MDKFIKGGIKMMNKKGPFSILSQGEVCFEYKRKIIIFSVIHKTKMNKIFDSFFNEYAKNEWQFKMFQIWLKTFRLVMKTVKWNLQNKKVVLFTDFEYYFEIRFYLLTSNSIIYLNLAFLLKLQIWMRENSCQSTNCIVKSDFFNFFTS